MAPPFPSLAAKWEDPILEKHFQAHTSSILSVSFSHNERQLASGSKDGVLKVWNMKPQVNSYSFKDNNGAINSVCFSPNGKLLASASGSTVRLRTPERKSELFSFRAHLMAVRCVDFSYDGLKLSTCSDDKSIKLWNIKNLNSKFDFSLVGHSNWVRSAKFSPDGKMMASCSDDNTVKFWDLTSRTCVRTCYGHTATVHTVDFHPNGFCLASGSSDETIRVWDLRMKRTLQVHEAHSGKVNSVNFHHVGQYLASSFTDSTVKIYDLLDGRLIYTLHGHEGSVNSVQFSKQGDHLCSADGSGKIFLWRTNFEHSVSTSAGFPPTVLSPVDQMNPLNDDFVLTRQQSSPTNRHRSRSVESGYNAEEHNSRNRPTTLSRNRTSPLINTDTSKESNLLLPSKLAHTLEDIVQQLSLLAETVGMLEKRLSRTEKKVQELFQKVNHN